MPTAPQPAPLTREERTAQACEALLNAAVEASAERQAGLDPRSEDFLDAHVDAVLALLAPEHLDPAG